MGYLDNRAITVDAVLTKKGRELLSKGHDFFKITQYALADDEIDYRLWNEAHPSGSSYFGYAIEQLPLLEAPIDETQVMRYKLVTLDKSTTRIPVVTVTPTTAVLQLPGDTIDITPNTLATANGVSFNQNLGYTVILHNSDAAFLYVLDPAPSSPFPQFTDSGDPARSGAGIFLSDSELSKSVWASGLRFRLIAKGLSTAIQTVVTIVGNESGGSATMNLTVRAQGDASRAPVIS